MDIVDETDKGHWNPSDEQFDTYEKREVELCMANLKAFGETTLHSMTTVARAKALLGDSYVAVPVHQSTFQPKSNGWLANPASRGTSSGVRR